MKSQIRHWILSPKSIFLMILLVSMIFISSCNLYSLSPPGWLPDKIIHGPGEESSGSSNSGDDQSTGKVPYPGEAGDFDTAAQKAFLEDETPDSGLAGQDAGSTAGSGELKPVGFVNYGEFDATVRAFSFIPLESTEPAPVPGADTVSTANDGVGTWPNTSRFISVPMGTYTWCIDWEEEDKDEDGYFDYYHYITGEPTVLDENNSDELEFAEEVSISAPPVSAMVYEGKCSEHPIDVSCAGKTTEIQTFIRLITLDPVYPVDVMALADTGHQPAPDGVSISVSGGALAYNGSMVLKSPGDWIEATTSDPYSAMGVQIFGDMTIGWARVLFDGNPVWEGDTSTCVIDAAENNGLGWYGIYVEARCFPPGTHTLRVESTKTKAGVGGWGGGVPVNLFGFRK